MPIVRCHTLLVKTERGFFMSNSLNGRKVAVIGCGFVGSTTAYSLMQSKLFTDMVLIDVDTNRAEGEALDISHGIPYYSPMNIYAGTYEDLSDASIVSSPLALTRSQAKRVSTWYRRMWQSSRPSFPALWNRALTAFSWWFRTR